MSRPSPYLWATCALVSTLLGACRESAPSAPAPPLAQAESSVALFVLTHSHGEAGVQVSGQVLSWSAFDELDTAQVLHTVALPEQVWLASSLTRTGPPSAGCQPLRTQRALPRHGQIDLLDAGALHVRGPAVLQQPGLDTYPRSLPPVVLRLAGVVYDAQAPDALPYVAAGRYHFAVDGAQVGPAAASILAPPAVRIEEILTDDAGLWVRWAGAPQAQIYLSHEQGQDSLGLACAGRAHELWVPWSQIEALGAESVELSISTSEAVSFSAEGLGEGILMFVVRDARQLRLSGAISQRIEPVKELREEELP